MLQAHNNMVANVNDPMSEFNKRTSRYVRTMRRAEVTVANWSAEQVENWLLKAGSRPFKHTYKYRTMVQERMAELTFDDLGINLIPF